MTEIIFPFGLAFALYGPRTDVAAQANLVVNVLERVGATWRDRGLSVELLTTRRAGQPFTPRAWAAARREILELRTDRAGVYVDGARPEDGELSLVFSDLLPDEQLTDIFRVYFFASGNHPRPVDVQEVTNTMLTLTREGQVVLGLMGPTTPPALLPKNEAPRLPGPYPWPRLGVEALGQWILQSAWGLWLTDGHLSRLGGRTRVQREAPVAVCQEYAEGMWLQLTISPAEVSDDAVVTLQRYLEPALSTRAHIGETYYHRPAPAEERRAPTVPEPEDRGAAVPFRWGDVRGLDLPLTVKLARPPSTEAARALESVVQAWYRAGAREQFAGGGLHGISAPNWEGNAPRWHVDFGPVHPTQALTDLRERLGGWALRWDCPVEELLTGEEFDIG